MKNPEIRYLHKTNKFDEFYTSLTNRAVKKLDEGLQYLKTVYVLSAKFVKKLESVDENLYELRISVGFNEYRVILFSIDHHNIIQTKNIILLNGFLKKDTKDYNKHINQAINLLNNIIQ